MGCCEDLSSAIQRLENNLQKSDCCADVASLKAQLASLSSRVQILEARNNQQAQNQDDVVQKAISGVFSDGKWLGLVALVGLVRTTSDAALGNALKGIDIAKANAEAAKYYAGRIDQARLAAEKAAKVGDAAQKTAQGASSLASRLTPLLGLVGVVGALLALAAAWQANEIQGARNDAIEKGLDSLSAFVSKFYGQYGATKAVAERADTLAKEAKQQANDALYAGNRANEKLVEVKQQANDALYAGNRANEKLVEVKQQANDALYAGNRANEKLVNLQEAIDGMNDILTSARKMANDALYSGDRANEKISNLEAAVTGISALATSARKMANDALYSGDRANQKIADLQGTVKRSDAALQSGIASIQEAVGKLAQLRQPRDGRDGRDGITPIKGRDYFDGKDGATGARGPVGATGATGARGPVGATGASGPAGVTGAPGPAGKDGAPGPAGKDGKDGKNGKDGKDVNDADVAAIKAGISGMQGAVNLQNNRLKSLEVSVGAIPGLIIPAIAQTPMNVGNFSPQANSQLEAAAATGVCKTTQPGGCMSKTIEPVTNGLNQANSKLDIANGALNAANFGLLNTINNTTNVMNSKLGSLLPGGLSGFISKAWDVLQMDRVINILTLYTALHNATMLSNDIFQTLITGVEQLLGVVGLKNEKDQPIQIRETVGKSIEEFLKNLMGAKEYEELKTRYAQFNRIYQATTNALNAITNIFYSLQNVLQVIGQYVAWIGNALRDWGVVADNAYAAMSERINATGQLGQIQNVIDGLQEASKVASTFTTITSEMVNVKQNVEELTKQKTEFDTALSAKVEAKTVIEKKQASESEAATIDYTDLLEVELDL